MQLMTNPFLRVSDAYEQMIYLLKSGASKEQVEVAHQRYLDAEAEYRLRIPDAPPLELQ